MKSSLSIEERFGKYYTKIKAKNFLSKQVSGEIKEEKKKIIYLLVNLKKTIKNYFILNNIKNPKK